MLYTNLYIYIYIYIRKAWHSGSHTERERERERETVSSVHTELMYFNAFRSVKTGFSMSSMREHALNKSCKQHAIKKQL